MKWMRILAAAALTFGLVSSAQAQFNDSEIPGSVLVFPKFLRGTVAVGPTGAQIDTPRTSFEISVVCPSGRSCPEFTDNVKLKALWVCGDTTQHPENKRICKATDFELFTTVKGTLWFNPANALYHLSPRNAATDKAFDTETNIPVAAGGVRAPFVPTPPCDEGYLIVYAINVNDQPISFNGLIGNAIIRLSANDADAYRAVPIQAIPAAGTVLSTNGNSPLAFDATMYKTLAGNIQGTVRYETVDAVNANGNVKNAQIETSITLLTLDVRANAPNLVTFVPLAFYNENERVISTFVEFICHKQLRLVEINTNLTQSFATLKALKGFVESTAVATQQNTNFPFDQFPATLLGILWTKERDKTNAGLTGYQRSYAYSLFHDSNPVVTHFCPFVGTSCPIP